MCFHKYIETNEVNEYGYNEWKNEYKGLNYNLTTGEYLEFEDLFTNTASIKNIVSQSSYTSLASKYLDEEYINTNTLETDMDTVKNPNLEEETFRIVNNYISGKKFEFYFSSNYIYLIDDENVIEIKMADFYEDIAIYNRFLSKTEIFENKSTKELYVFINRYNAYLGIPYYLRIEEIQEGLFVDFVVYPSDSNEINKAYDLCIAQINKEIENYKKEINSQPNAAMIISITVCPNDSIEENRITYYKSIYKMTRDYYNNNMFTKIIDQAQYPVESGSIGIEYYNENFEEEDCYEDRIYDLEKKVYYITEPVTVQNGNTWTTVDEIIKTYNAITGELIKEESLAENERSHAIMNNMYVQ
ncbi:MAG: hypothetical protein ACI4UE_00825 [Candidatus Scatovivens sp.]